MYIKATQDEIKLISQYEREGTVYAETPNDLKFHMNDGKYSWDGEQIVENLDWIDPSKRPDDSATKSNLEFWLTYHNQDDTGLKSELLQRAQDYYDQNLQDEPII